MSKFSKLYVVKTCGTITPDHFACAPNTIREYKKIITMEYYILIHPEYGLMLIDTGMVYDTAPKSVSNTLAGVEMTTIDFQLAEIGYKTTDVKHIIISHLHFDHVSQVHMFPEAIIHVAKTEVDGIRADDDVYPSIDKDVFEAWEKIHKIKFDLMPDDDEYDIFRDGSIIAVNTKGHTPGHRSFIVNLAKQGEMLLIMDATHSVAELYNPDYLPHPWNYDELCKSLNKLINYRDNKGYTLCICHDPEQWPDMTQFPEYYELTRGEII